MSDRIIKSYTGSVERAKQPMHSYESLWMSHWMGASSNTALQEQNQLSSPVGDNEDDRGTNQLQLLSGVEIASDISESAKGPTEVKAINFEIINESPPMNSRNLRNGILGSRDSPAVNLSKKSGSSSILKIDHDTKDTQVQNLERGTTALYTSGSFFPSILSVAPPSTEISARECCIQHQSVLENPKELMKSHMIFGSSFAFSKSSQDNFTDMTSHVSPSGFDHGECRFDSESIAAPSFIRSRQEKVNHLRSVLASKKYLLDTKVTVPEQEKCDYHHSYSEILVGNKNMDKCSTSGKSVIPYLRKENDSSLLVNDQSTNNNHSPAIREEQYQKMKNYPAISLFPSCSSLPKLTKLEMLHHECCFHIKPSSAHNAKTTRICTSVDSVEEVGGSPPRISQTTHSLLITKKTDVNLCKENQIFRESRVLAQGKEKSSSELHNFYQLCGHGQEGVKLQLLGSSADGEGKDNVQDVNALEVVPKNESSAETDTMDMDKFKENHLSGVNSSPQDKDVMAGMYLPPYDAVASAQEVSRKRPIPELPDINIELPALPAAASSIDNAEPSTSRTQSLDMDILLNAEQPSSAKSKNCQDDHLGSEPCSRWIKRLKLVGSCSFSHGTKSWNLGEASHEKVTKFYGKIMKGEIINSEPTLPKCTGKALTVLCQKTASVKNGDSSSVDVDKGEDITLSHFWIRRWRRNKAATPQKKAKAVVVCDPQSSKVTLEDFQKKQCPSIAAMALMGKAMNGFQPCEFQNRGSFIVWNTKGL